MERPIWSQISGYQDTFINGTKSSFNVDSVTEKYKECKCKGIRKHLSLHTNRKYFAIIKKFAVEVKVYMVKNIKLNLYYCKNEVDLQFRNNELTTESVGKLKWIKYDLSKLNIVEQINDSYKKYVTIMKNENMYHNCKCLKTVYKVLLKRSILHYNDCMKRFLEEKRIDAIDECFKKCKTGMKTFNFTENNIPKETTKLLDKGLNFVPKVVPTVESINKDFNTYVNEIIIGTYEGKTKKKVQLGTNKVNLSNYSHNEIMSIICMQPDCTGEIVETLNDFISEAFKNKNDLIRSQIKTKCKHKRIEIFDIDGNTTGRYRCIHRDKCRYAEMYEKLEIDDSFVSAADKGIGTTILPKAWYVKEFDLLKENTNYEFTEMNSEKCIKWLLEKCNEFIKELNENENKIFKELFKKEHGEHKVACIRLIGKVHKLKCKPSFSVHNEVPSRIVRGGEQCPINPYSKTLKELLTEILTDLKNNFNRICNENRKFPLIIGCEEMEGILKDVVLPAKKTFKTLLITSDFKDAFVNATLEQLIEAVKKACAWLNYDKSKQSLIIKLAILCITTCTFETPDGVAISKNGYPIGGHSSCECLNVTLAVSEIDAILTMPTDNNTLISIVRLVDDVNYIFNGDFDEIIAILKHFGSMYPNILLNVQISPRISTFLDYKIFNLFYGQEKLITSLSRKELNNYNYVLPSSNVVKSYKGCVVESTMHRIEGRCTEEKDKFIQKMYMYLIMLSKHYSRSVVFNRIAKYKHKKKYGKAKAEIDYSNRIRAKIKYDKATKLCDFFRILSKKISKKLNIEGPNIVPTLKLKNFIKTKREITSEIKEYKNALNLV